MREILFRGKRLDNGEWVQGYYYQIWEKGYILWGMINDVPDMIEVDPETVCQYTGLTDKNGKKIFEGDIVKTVHHSSSDENIGKVYFEDFTWFAAGDYLSYVRDNCEIEVIGNIFDNPELLNT